MALFLWFLQRIIFWVNYIFNNKYEYEIGYHSSIFLYISCPFCEKKTESFFQTVRFKEPIQNYN